MTGQQSYATATPPAMDTEWIKQGACRPHDPQMWFPGGKTNRNAVLICLRCPVRQACLDYAMTIEGRIKASGRHGIYGGLTGDQRARLARQVGQTP